MARGQLGIKLLEHFQEHPEAQTIKEVKDVALPGISGGAIGYALDKLVVEGKIVKLEGRPARYQLADGSAPAAEALAPRPAPTKPRAPAKSKPKPPPEVDDDEEILPARKSKGKRHPCGFCSTSNNLDYHKKHCPVKIPKANAGQDWYCPCAEEGHNRARDYDEHRAKAVAEAKSGGNPDKLMSCPCGRGDYDLCEKCPYDTCSVHGMVNAS